MTCKLHRNQSKQISNKVRNRRTRAAATRRWKKEEEMRRLQEEKTSEDENDSDEDGEREGEISQVRLVACPDKCEQA
jgi:hypothetical protein